MSGWDEAVRRKSGRNLDKYGAE